jgi:hypothetical protein
MEFQGRVKKILPLRSGVSQRTGNEWKSLPFVFEYHEHETDRYADSVVLETFDTNVIDNLKEGMEVICGFGHKAKPITKQDGTQTIVNEMRLYKIESVRGARAAQQAPQGANAPAEAQQTVAQPIAVQTAKNDADDDLPF